MTRRKLQKSCNEVKEGGEDNGMISICLTLIDSEGDKQRFIHLYEQYRHLMFYVAYDILKDESLAEDALQEAFLRIAKNFHKVGEISCPRTRNFAVIITRNAAITMVRKKHDHLELDTFSEKETAAVSDDVFETVSNKILIECILKLPEIYRDTFYLHHIYGYTFNEISHLLSVPVETLKKRAQRARRMLRELCEKEGYHHEEQF